MKDGQKINGAKSAPQNGKGSQDKNSSSPVAFDERAQYEVFRNGDLPRDTIKKWIIGDLDAVAGFVHAVKSDGAVLEALTDSLYSKYLKFHQNVPNNDESNGE